MLSTPIARSKTSALTRVLDVVPRGYTRYTSGTIASSKVANLASKFHAAYGIAVTPAQRITRKQKGIASSILTIYWPEGSERADWILLSTPGSGLEAEQMKGVVDHRLTWLGYELVRRAQRGRTGWTWRRPKQSMRDLYTLLTQQINQRAYSAVDESLRRIAAQPGFHGVREQSWALCQFARQRGYPGKFPYIYFVQKVTHGDPLRITQGND
jgi:hypothetical protein